MHVLPSTWAFPIRHFLIGLVKKFKAHFCVHGDCQQEVVDFWETWSPIVQWSMVRLMMTLAAKLDLCLAQADITSALSMMNSNLESRSLFGKPRVSNGMVILFSLSSMLSMVCVKHLVCSFDISPAPLQHMG